MNLLHPPRAARALFTAALRSGQYPAGQSVLCRLDDDDRPVGFCPLGVACETFIAHERRRLPTCSFVWNGKLRCRRYGGRAIGLPGLVQSWLGFRSEFGVFNDLAGLPVVAIDRAHGGVPFSSVIALADAAGWSFAAIADVIDRQPAGLLWPDDDRREVAA